MEFNILKGLSGICSLAVFVAASAQGAVEIGAGGAATEGDAVAGLEEIVVTAQRREENLQKSSLSLQVISGKQLETATLTDVQNLNVLVPGIQIAVIGATPQVFIRGVGDDSSNPLGDPSVAFNIDGVYIGRTTSVSSNFFDVSRIEVLKGPQGTLYGRNASGGAVNIITTEPTLNALQGYAEVGGGNYSTGEATGAINLPLGQTFAVRAAFQVVGHEGYLSDGSNDQRSQAGRVHALWTPDDVVSLTLSLDGGHQGGYGNSQVLLPSVDSRNPWLAVNSPAVGAILSTYPGALPNQGVPSQDNKFFNASADLSVNFDPLTLTVVPAFRHTNEDYVTWNGFLYSQLNTAVQKSLEVRLAENLNRIKWVGGIYYFNEKQNVNAIAETSEFAQNANLLYKPTTKAYAAFGDSTFSVVDALRLIAGLRYTHEQKSISGENLDRSLLFGTPAGRLSEVISGDQTFTDTTWKAGAEYDLSPNNMLFLTASTGFKAGGLNPTAGSNAYAPEKLTAYTFGSRNRFLENRLQVNVEVFDWQYKDKQEGAISFSPAGNLAFITRNAADATIRGAELNISGLLTPADSVTANAVYNHARYGRFIEQLVNIPGVFPFNPSSTGCRATPGAPGSETVDCSGFDLPRAPAWAGSLGYDHRFDLPTGASLRMGANVQFSSTYWLASDFVAAEHVAGYGLFNADLTYSSSSGNWTVVGYVKNIGDKPVYFGANELPIEAPNIVASIGAPRTYGAKVRYRFQ